MLQFWFYVLKFSLVGPAVVAGLIALWAANSRRHWFVRALAAWAGVIALVPIRAYEPAAVFAIAAVVIICLELLTQWLHNRRVVANATRDEEETRSTFRFGLRDLFLLTLLVGLALLAAEMINRRYDWRDWVAFAIIGINIAAVVFLAKAFATGQRRLLSGLLLLVVIAIAPFAISATAPHTKAERIWQMFGIFYSLPFDLGDLITIGLLHTALALWIVVLTSLQQIQRWWPNRGRLRIAARSAMVLLATIQGVWLVWLYSQMLWLTPFPPPVASETNHYRRLAEISESLGPGRLPSTDVRALAAEARVLLENSNYVELDTTGTDHNAKTSAMREIRRVFDADAKAAMILNDHDQAAELAIANLRLGAMLGRGGTELDAAVGASCVGVGIATISEVRTSLSPEAQRTTILALQRVLAESESVETISARDAAFYGWQTRLENVLFKFLEKRSAGAVTLGGARQRLETRNALLQVDLAVRSFQHDHGKLPGTLTELVPTYLPAVPQDPFSPSKSSVCYRMEGESFIVYSVGHDGNDNGGRLANERDYWWHWQDGDYDYDLDMPTRP